MDVAHKAIDVGVSKHIGKYSDAIEVESGLRWLFTSGTPGVDADGKIPPDIETQTRLVWKAIGEALAAAGMSWSDLVKVSTSLIDGREIPAYVKIRSEILGDVRPAFMLSVVSGLIRPDVRVEVEVVAAKA